MATYPSKYAPIPVPDLNNWNTDRDVEPVVMTRGVMYKTGGTWYFWDGFSKSEDAGLMRVSAVGGGTVTFDGDATNNRVSAFSDDAGKMRVSAIGVTVTTSPLSCDGSSVSAFQDNPTRLKVSSFSDDAGKMRVSAVGVTITGVLSANQSISALGLEGTAHIGQVSAILVDNPVNATYLGRVSTIQLDAAFNRCSAIGTQIVSAHEVKQSDAASLMVSTRFTDDATINKFFGRMSAISEGANLMRVSVITGSLVSATAKEGTSFIGNVSATLKAGTASIGLVSATNKEGTAFIGQVSAILKDNPVNATYLGRVSTVGSVAISANQQLSAYLIEATAHVGSVSAVLVDDATANKFLGRVSALGVTASLDGSATNNRVSAFQTDASTLMVSAKSDDAGLMRVSAVGIQVTGGISANESLSARILEGSAFIGQVSAILKDNPTNATYLGRVSGIIDSGSVSAKSGDADQVRISAFSNDATLFRVSAIGLTTGGLSANQSISAVNMEGSAFIGQVSAILKDNPVNATYLGRVSTVGSVAVSANQSLSALMLEGTAFIGQVSAILKDNAVNATYLGRVSAITTTALLVSAHEVKQSDAASLRISAYADDAAKFRVSAIGTQTVSAHEVKQSDGASMRVSAVQDGAAALNVSCKSITAATMLVSAMQGDAALERVSALWAQKLDATNDAISCKSNDGALMRVSVISEGAGVARVSTFSSVANGMVVSAVQSDAAIFRTSAYIPVDTVGQMSVFRSLSLSASQAVKATAGAVYGYYLFNTTTVPQYVKLTNTSGAINVGTDVPIATLMLPASAAANVWFGQGLKGFTAGIGVHATSAVADDATTPAAASAVGGNIFYN